MPKADNKESVKKSGRQNAEKKYGVINNRNEAAVARKMGVPEKNIVSASELNSLLTHMAAGDILCVPTISSFSGSAYDLFCKMMFLSNHGIEFVSGNEFYLNFSSVKPLSVVTVETLKIIASREVEFIKWVQMSKLSDAAKIPIINRIQEESLAVVSLVFKNNGIKKKGN